MSEYNYVEGSLNFVATQRYIENLNGHVHPALVQPGSVPHEPSTVPDCSACHRPTGSAPLPEDHKKRAEDLCSFCHAGSKTPPSAPHSRLWTDCASCHKQGSAIAPPRTHQGTAWEKCSIPECHGVVDYW